MWTRAPALITTIMVLIALMAALLVAIVGYREQVSSHASTYQAITVVSATTPDATTTIIHDF